MKNPLLLLILAVAVAAGAWWWLHRAPAAPQGAMGGMGVPVEATTAITAPLAETLTVSGQTLPLTGAELRSEVTARVTAIAFKDGQKVKAGDLLFALDDAAQKAAVAQAKATYELARTNRTRYENLQKIGAASKLQVEQAQAEEKLQLANLQAAQTTLGKYRVTAPFAGTTGIAQVNVGGMVQPNALLVTLTDNSQLKATFNVPEADAASLTAGSPLTVTAENATVSATLAAVDSRIDPATRTLQGKALMDNADGTLIAGQFVRITVPVHAVSDAVVVPNTALVPQGDTTYVYILVPGEKGATMASRTTVTLGLRTADASQILSGVQAGQSVVTAGQQKLQAPFMPVMASSPTTITVAPQAVEELK